MPTGDLDAITGWCSRLPTAVCQEFLILDRYTDGIPRTQSVDILASLCALRLFGADPGPALKIQLMLSILNTYHRLLGHA